MSDEDMSEVDVDEDRLASRASQLERDDDVNNQDAKAQNQGAKAQARAILEAGDAQPRL